MMIVMLNVCLFSNFSRDDEGISHGIASILLRKFIFLKFLTGDKKEWSFKSIFSLKC